MSTTYWSLRNGALRQDWSNTNQITAANDWSGVPSIVGYRGDDLTTTTGTDPQTVLTSTAAGETLNVQANQTNPNTNTGGGLAEFELPNPVVALQGSATADAPYLQIFLDATGQQSVTLTFTARDIDGSTDNAIQQIAVQYRVGTSGTWTNLPAGYIADATTGPSLATAATNVTVTLPADANNAAQIQIRIMTTNAVGNDEWVGIDDIVVSSAPIDTVSPGALSVADVAFVEGNAGTTDLTFTVSRPAGSSGEVTVHYTVAPATATAGIDYTIANATGTLSFGASELSKTVIVQVNGDYAVEANETLTITLDTPTGGATIARASATGTITNDDAVGSFAVSATTPTIVEGDTGTSAGSFTITRTGGASGSVTIDYVIAADGTGGRIGTDDGLIVTGGLTGSVTFAEGQTTATIPYTVTGDRTVEGNETIPITISTTTPNAVISTATATATVTNDDVAGTVSLSNATYGFSEGIGTATFTVTRTGGSGDFTVDFATAPGTATSPADFTATSGTVSFTGGDQTRTITVPIVDDSVVEGDESFTLTLSNPTAGATIGTATATANIFDNDTAAVPGSVSVASASIVEGDAGTSNLVVTLTRTGGTAAFTVDYTTADGGRPGYAAATAGSDYTATAGTVTFGTGANTATVTIPIVGDTVAELSEEFRLLLSNASNGATIGTASALLKITNDDTLPASTRIFSETFDGFTAAGFAPTPGAGQLSSNVWRVTGMSDAPAPAYGFTGPSGGDFGRGAIVNNESGGGVYSPTGAQALVVQPTGTDFAPGSFVEARVQNVSGAAATAFDVAFDWAYRNNETRGEVMSFAWSTDGTSFTTVSGAGITIADAADTNGFVLAPRTASLTGLSVADQGYLYLRWTYVSTSGSGSRDEIGIDNVTVNRVGGSALPTVAVSDVSVSEAAGTMTFTVTRTNVASGAFSVGYATADGIATAGSDYTATSGTLNFADNQVSATVTVPITNDARPEFDETLLLTLSNPSGANIVRASATGTITNDDGAPIQVAIGNASVLEGDSGTATLLFTVTRTGGTGAFSVGYATADGTATAAGGDYAATSGTLTFADGETSKTISVTINGDTLRESNETLSVVLSDPTNDAILTTATGTGTILNDEPTLISEIQGSSYFSPIVAGAGITGFGTGASTTVNATSFTVTVRAVVTAIDGVGNRQGFYITEEKSDWDASDLTSEGIYVMTATDTAGVGTPVLTAIPSLQVGQLVTVTANVMEYRPFATNGPLTVLVNPVVTLGAGGQEIPVLTLDSTHKIPNALLTGVAPDFTDSVDDPGDSFDATNYAMSFFETIEGMLVTVPDVRVADGFTSTVTGGGVNFKVYSGVSANPEQINSRGGYTIGGDPKLSPPDTASTNDDVIAGGKGVTDGDINPDILEIDFSDFAIGAPTYVTDGKLSMGDKLGDVTGIVEWNFTDMKLFPTAVGTFTDTVLTKEVTTIVADPRALTFATFNVENLAGNAAQTRFDAIAQVIANSLGSPAILSIEEIQDNNGAATGGVTVDGVTYGPSDATITWTRLVNAVNQATGRTYQWVDQSPVNGAEGGEPGGNIRVGFLYDTGRVQLGNLAADAPIEERRKWVDRLGDNVRDAGDLIAVSDNMVSGINTADYTTTRLSLLGQFTFNGNTVFALANHLPSKGGSGTFWDASGINPQNGTPVNSDWTQRSNIGEDIYSLLNMVQAQVPGARILSGGDYNDFYFYRPLETATGYVYADGTARNDGAKLVNLALALPEAERYTYTFDGRSQAIDHILADAATAAAATTDVVHINSGFSTAQRISDHDPVLTSIDMRGFGEVLSGTSADETIEGFGGDDVIDGKGGTDRLLGGDGNDRFVFTTVSFTSPFPPIGLIDGGAGFDTVDLRGVSGTQLGTIQLTDGSYTQGIFVGSQRFELRGVERILFGDSGSRIAITPSFPATIDLVGGAGADDFTLMGNFTAAGGGGDDSFFLSGAFGSASETGTIDGGLGTDTLSLNIGFTVDLAAGTAQAGVSSYTITGIERVQGNASGNSGVGSIVYGTTGADIFEVRSLFDDGTAGVRYYGRDGDDQLSGGKGADRLEGGDGNDILDGKGGADAMIGGLGNDIFYVDSLDDVVIENAGEGFDEVRTTLSNYVLPANVERLTLLGAAAGGAQTVSGNGGDNTLTGSAGGDIINIAQGGSDTVNAGDGNDGVFVGAALDASDRIDGGAGTLDQVGFQGNYTTQLVLGADTVKNVEMFVFLAGSDTRFGASGTESYSYNVKSNDAMVAAGQQFIVQANTLRASETLIFDGSSEQDGSFLTYGGLGTDILTGGAQNDSFYFGQDRFNATDRVDGGAGAMDQLGLQGDYDGAKAIVFGAAQLTNIEMIVLLSGADTRFGNGALRFGYTLTMDDANAVGAMTIQANTLRSDEVLILDASRETAASYTVFAGAAADTIIGGGGADILWGRGGGDRLTGGAGNDVFAYFAATDSFGSGADRDTITDFARGDVIDVSRLGIARVVTGSFAADGTGQIRATSAGGGDWLIEGDVDGNGVADLAILVTAGSGYAWAASDFRLAGAASSGLDPLHSGDTLALVA